MYFRSPDSRDVLYPVKIFPAAQALSYVPELSQFPSPPSEQLVSGTHISTGNPARLLYPKSARWRVGKSQSLRTKLRLLALLNASLNLVVSALGYEVVCEERKREAMKWIVALFSVVQVGLVGLHAKLFQQWKESQRQELKLGSTPVQRLSESKRALTLCMVEICFHLLVFPPGVAVQWKVHMLGTHCYLTLDACLYLLLLLRNYHIVSYLFWQSSLSTRRPALFLKVANVEPSYKFALKYCISVYGLALVLGLYTATVLLFGLTLHVLETNTPNSGLNSVSNSAWFLTMTQATIGYGDITPKTYTCTLVVLLACFMAYCTLSLLIYLISRYFTMSSSQLSLYIALNYAHRKRQQYKAAVLLIQAWWRLILKRMRHCSLGTVVIAFYYQQSKYQQVLRTCHSVPYRRLQWEVEEVAASVTTRFLKATESLQWTKGAKAMVRARPGHRLCELTVQHNAQD